MVAPLLTGSFQDKTTELPEFDVLTEVGASGKYAQSKDVVLE